MPVDMSAINTILASYNAGVARKRQNRVDEEQKRQFEIKTAQDQQQFDLQEGRRTEEAKAKFAQEKAELERQALRDKLLQTTRDTEVKMKKLELGDKFRQGVMDTGQTPSGFNVKDIQITDPMAESAMLTYANPELGIEFSAPDFQTAREQKMQAASDAMLPKKELEDRKARLRADNDAAAAETKRKHDLELEETRSKHRKEVAMIQGEARYRTAIEAAKVRNMGRKEKADPLDRPLSPDENERFDTPMGTTMRDVVGKKPGVKLNASQTNKLASLSTLETQIMDATEKLDRVGYDSVFKGPISGTSTEIGRTMGKRDAKLEEVYADLANLEALFAKERAGTSFTANEQAMMERYIVKASAREDPIAAKEKLKSLLKFVRLSRADMLGASANRTIQPEAGAARKGDKVWNPQTKKFEDAQ